MLIKNGRVIDPESGFDGLADLLIEDGKIKKIVKRVDGGADNTVPERVNGADEVLDASGMIIAPGLVDVHVHFRDPGLTHKEILKPAPLRQKRADIRRWSAWLIQIRPQIIRTQSAIS